MIRLFTTLYKEKNSARLAEHFECLRRNSECAAIAEVCIFSEQCNHLVPNVSRIISRHVDSRPTYSQFLDWINELASPDDLSIIANTDIWFDDSIRMIDGFDFGDRTILVVSRWDVQHDGSVRLFDRGDSQDVWIIRGKAGNVRGDFPLGVLECDDKIAWEFQEAGYRVVNPALSARTYHLHLTGYRSYEIAPAPDYGIRPPYLHVEPDNLFGPLTAWKMKKEYGLNYFPWKMTWKRFWRYPIPTLVSRTWNKGKRMFRPDRTSSVTAKRTS